MGKKYWTTKQLIMTHSIIALQPASLDNLEYQVTLILKERKSYLNSINILFNNKIIKKINKSDELMVYSEKNVNKVLDEYFSQLFSTQKKRKAGTFARLTFHLHTALHQLCQLGADAQAKTGAAVFACC